MLDQWRKFCKKILFFLFSLCVYVCWGTCQFRFWDLLSACVRARVCVYLWARNVDLRFNATLSNTYPECIVLSLSLSLFLFSFVFSFYAAIEVRGEREERLTSISTTYSTVRYSSTSSFKKECEETTTKEKKKRNNAPQHFCLIRERRCMHTSSRECSLKSDMDTHAQLLFSIAIAIAP